MDKTEIVYDFIVKFVSSNGYPPSIREICNYVKLDSTSSVVYHLKSWKMQEKLLEMEIKIVL